MRKEVSVWEREVIDLCRMSLCYYCIDRVVCLCCFTVNCFVRYHGFSVLQFTYWALKMSCATNFLTKLDVLGLLVAALCHDVDHPGRSVLYSLWNCFVYLCPRSLSLSLFFCLSHLPHTYTNTNGIIFLRVLLVL